MAVEVADGLLEFGGVNAWGNAEGGACLVSDTSNLGDTDAAIQPPWGGICVSIIYSRSSDKTASIRAKALQSLSRVVGKLLDTSEELFVFAMQASSMMKSPLQDKSCCEREEGHSHEMLPSSAPTNFSKGDQDDHDRMKSGASEPIISLNRSISPSYCFFIDPMEVLDGLLHLVYRRSHDVSAHVRKASVTLAQRILGSSKGLQSFLNKPWIENAYASLLGDASIIVRKLALQSIYFLMESHCDSAEARYVFASLWVTRCLPLIKDSETSISSIVSDQVRSFLTSRMDTRLQMPILDAISHGGTICQVHIGHCVQSIGTDGIKWKSVVDKFVKIVELEEGKSSTNGAWILLEEIVVRTKSAINWKFLDSQYDACTDEFDTSKVSPLLKTICALSRVNPPPDDGLSNKLREKAFCFDIGHQAAGPLIQALWTSSSQTLKAIWVPEMQSKILLVLRALATKLLKAADGDVDQSLLQTALIACIISGELVLLDSFESNSELISTEYARDLLSLLQGILSQRAVQSITDTDSSPLAVFCSQAWTAVGKFCLTDSTMAQKCITWIIQV